MPTGTSPDGLDDAVGQVDLPCDPGLIVTTSDTEGATDQPGDMSGQRLMRLSWVEGRHLDQALISRRQPLGQRSRDQVLIDPRTHIPHVLKVAVPSPSAGSDAKVTGSPLPRENGPRA
jgi:hypothetical protein